MPWLANRDSIIERLRARPESAARLWVEAGRERASAAIIDEARRAGVSVRGSPAEQIARRFKGIRSHVCLEVEEFAYIDAEVVLEDIASLKRPFFVAFDGVYDPQNLGNAVKDGRLLRVGDAAFIPRDKACGVTDTVVNVSRGGDGARQDKPCGEHGAPHRRAEEKERLLLRPRREGRKNHCARRTLQFPLCLVLGGEEGLRRLTRGEVRHASEGTDRGGFSVLSTVASAFAASAYEVVRQRVRYDR